MIELNKNYDTGSYTGEKSNNLLFLYKIILKLRNKISAFLSENEIILLKANYRYKNYFLKMYNKIISIFI